MSKARREYIHGMNPAFEVIRGGRRTIYQAWLNEASSRQPRMQKLAAVLERNDIPIEWTDKGRIMDLAQSKEHQGVALKCSTYPYTPFEEMLSQPRILLLDNIEDPHNVGAILRSAEIFGFSSVVLPMKGSPDIYPSVVKVSAGATEFMQIGKETSSNNYVKKAMDAGFTVAALDGKGETMLTDIRAGDFEHFMLVIGGEDTSVGQYILNQADYILRIPQQGRINSLNASVAASIAMYSLTR